MKTFTKSALTLFTAAALSTAAVANEDALAEAQSRVDAIASQLESMGAEVDATVDFNEAALSAKYDELQAQLESLQAQTAE